MARKKERKNNLKQPADTLHSSSLCQWFPSPTTHVAMIMARHVRSTNHYHYHTISWRRLLHACAIFNHFLGTQIVLIGWKLCVKNQFIHRFDLYRGLNFGFPWQRPGFSRMSSPWNCRASVIERGNASATESHAVRLCLPYQQANDYRLCLRRYGERYGC